MAKQEILNDEALDDFVVRHLGSIRCSSDGSELQAKSISLEVEYAQRYEFHQATDSEVRDDTRSQDIGDGSERIKQSKDECRTHPTGAAKRESWNSKK